MNPPFGAAAVGTTDYLKAGYLAGATDLFAAFVERGKSLLNEWGLCGVLTSRNALFLITFEPWRREILLPALQCCIDLGLGVLHEALVEASAYVVRRTAGETAWFAACLEAEDKGSAIVEAISSAHAVLKSDLAAIPGAPFAYWVSESVQQLFRNFPPLEGEHTAVRKGGYSGDDFRRVRAWWEVEPQKIGVAEGWVPYAKGGSQIPYYREPVVVAAWDHRRRTYREFYGRPGRPSELPDNVDYYFRPGLYWTRRTQAGFSARILPEGFALSDRSPAAFSDDESIRWRILGYLNSSIAWSAISAMVGFASFEVGVIQRLPLPQIPDRIGQLAQEAASAMRDVAAGDETQRSFVAPTTRDSRAAALDRATKVANEIDALLSAANGIPLADVGDEIAPTIEILKRLRAEEAAEEEDWLSYLVGCALGRWDIRVARNKGLDAGSGGPFDALPKCSPGMLVGPTGLPSQEPGEYPLSLPPDRILHDDPVHGFDIVRALENAGEELFAEGGVSLARNVARLTKGDLRGFMRRKYFPGHLKRYSQSNRKAPIYWYLAAPSKEWGLWVYAPSLSREQLFAIARVSQEKLRRLSEEAGQLRRDLESDGGREVREQLEMVEELTREIEVFYKKADEVAQSGWEPDLNDGIILNAAPLEGLFADAKWRKDIAKHREKMENGEYPWATVQQTYFDRLKS